MEEAIEMFRIKRVSGARASATSGIPRVLIAGAALLAAGLVAVTSATTEGQAGFPGANGPIAFVSDRDSPLPVINDDIYVTDETGAAPIRLTSDPAFDDFPAVSPNGKEIVFASTRNTAEFPNPERDAELYVMDVSDDDHDGNGDNLRRLTDNAASDAGPAWSPGGRKIAFSSFLDGDGDVYVIDADGPATATNLTNEAPGEPRRFDGQPVFAPDGSRIAFISLRDGNINIYLMDADGSDPTRITSSPAADAQPEFSPDGTSLAFTSTRDGDNDIYLVNAEPEGPANVAVNLTDALRTSTGAVLNDRWPAWSPDGGKIAFFTGTGPTLADTEIYTINTDSTNPTNITNTPAPIGDVRPDWGPARTR
jgi:Tol biopolymer transport system component